MVIKLALIERSRVPTRRSNTGLGISVTLSSSLLVTQGRRFQPKPPAVLPLSGKALVSDSLLQSPLAHREPMASRPRAIPIGDQEFGAQTMRRVTTTVIFLIALVATAIAATEQKFAVSGFGGYPISGNITTLWLSGPHRHPILLVYFCGPNDWHKTLWNINSRFDKGKLGWAELQSENVTLRLEFDAETGEARVQSSEFKIGEKNVFLVLYTGELLVPQKIIPLGLFDLPRSNGQPASILLLQAHPELMARIKAELSSGNHSSKVGKTLRHPSPVWAWPCTAKHLDDIHKNTAMVGATLHFRMQLAPARILRSTYSLPCCRNLGSCH
jgi:hypothetical protein